MGPSIRRHRTLTRLAFAAGALVLVGACKKKPEEPIEPAAEPKELAEAKPEEAIEKAAVPSFPSMPIPADNPQTDAKIALGHQLFFDKRLSVDGSRSCYSCHQNEHGNGGETPLAVGAQEKPLTRHSPSIWNVGYLDALYWDGRAPTLEAQALGAWGGGNMGVGKDNLAKKAAELSKIQGYATQFEAVFPGEGLTPDTVAKAISAYERTLICDDSAYDRFAGGDESALNAEQKRGLALFTGKAQCVLCHAPPFFSNAMGVEGGLFYNIGIGTRGKAEAEVDPGRAAVTENDSDWAAFKIPSLRNVSKSAPYFHDGSVASLEQAVALMASGGIDNKNKTPILKNQGLSSEEIGAITAFLGALDCEQALEEPELPE
jgi:cytochrome c peroxidase